MRYNTNLIFESWPSIITFVLVFMLVPANVHLLLLVFEDNTDTDSVQILLMFLFVVTSWHYDWKDCGILREEE